MKDLLSKVTLMNVAGNYYTNFMLDVELRSFN